MKVGTEDPWGAPRSFALQLTPGCIVPWNNPLGIAGFAVEPPPR